MMAIGALSIFFVFFILFLAFRRSLIPDVIILGSSILFVLWLTGLIGTSIQLYGSAANVNSNCENYVVHQEYKGPSINTLAWLTQITICKSFIQFPFPHEWGDCLCLSSSFVLTCVVRTSR